MDVLQAARGGIEAWSNNVTEATIRNCWLKARVLCTKMGPQTKEEAQKDGWREQAIVDEGRLNATVFQINSTVAKQPSSKNLVASSSLKQAMPIETWLNPVTEVIDDEEEDLIDQIAESHTQVFLILRTR
jgi:hypothetical protein